MLDNLFGCCWYKVLSRKQPAYKQLSKEQLEKAIAIAQSMIDQPDEYIRQLNQNSLNWRGKDRPSRSA